MICYNVILHDYDNLREPESRGGAKWVCFTDRPRYVAPWEGWPCPQPFADPRRNSRIPKILPHLCMDAEISLYHDACFRLKESPEWFVREWLGDADVALFQHPARGSIYEEIQLCLKEGIGHPPEMEDQVERYRADKIGDGLWAGGFILRRHNERTEAFNEMWWREYLRGSERDQFALAYAVQRSGAKVRTIQGDILTCPHFEFMFHASFVQHKDNGKYAEENQAWTKKRAHLMELCR